MMKQRVFSGADRIETIADRLRGKRVGLMTNPTGIDRQFRSTIDRVHAMARLTALYAVEHGIRGMEQAGAEVRNSVDEATGIPVFSAYGANDHFTDEMLDAFDVLIFDIQDVGARFYTYLYSLSYAMMACARGGKEMIVLDRINPLGGIKRSGTVLDTRFSSFVGDYALPTRYGLTIGEYARYVKDYLKLDVALTVVPLEGWDRRLYLDDTDLPWVAPSPNCPDLAAAICYIGTCIFEGCNVSEGRGTTQPFQVIGAPFIDGECLAKEMNALGLSGLYFRPTAFTPTFSKWQGEMCRGVQMHVTDRDLADPFVGGLLLMDEIRRETGDSFSFIHWGEDPKYSLDKLLGTDLYRTGRVTARELIEMSREPVDDFSRRAEAFLLYR